jgi:hypothetical protein
MGNILICDICRKACTHHVGKLFYAPTIRGGDTAKSFHNNYQLHLDVGECCEDKLKKTFMWRKLQSAQE